MPSNEEKKNSVLFIMASLDEFTVPGTWPHIEMKMDCKHIAEKG